MDPVIKSHKATNKNAGDEQGVQHLVQQLELGGKQNAAFSEGQNKLLAAARESISQSRQAVEKLKDSISNDDRDAKGILGPIVSRLRNAERDIGTL